MNNYDLGTLLTEFRNRYPMIYNWVEGQTSELVDNWLDILRDVPIQSAVDIVKFWHKHGAPFTAEPNKWQEIPRYILSEYHKSNSSSGAYNENLRRNRKIRPSNLAETVARVLRTRNDAMRKEIIQQAIAALPPDDRDDLPRYKCHKCQDTGYVTMYLDYLTTAGAICGCCERGQNLSRDQKQSSAMIQVYDPKKFPWFIAADRQSTQEHIDRWREMSHAQRYQAYTGRKQIDEHEF